ncbi:MAG: hypothetical protein WC269_04285 [Candidatus Gracilibacteria bacterium]|jgi:hypothetical protein
MENNTLEKEFQYFLDHQKELVKQYSGKFIVIKNQEIIGVYTSESEAFTETQKKHELGTFLIQECKPGTDVYTQTFHSRVLLRN